MIDEEFVKIVNLDSVTSLVLNFLKKYNIKDLKEDENFIKLFNHYFNLINTKQSINTLRHSTIISYDISKEDILFNISEILIISKGELLNTNDINNLYSKIFSKSQD